MPIYANARAHRPRRAATLDSAAKVLAERGYENTRYSDVAEMSGLAVSTLQNYFGSREHMLIETLRHAVEVELLAFDAVASAEVDPWNRLIALIDRHLNTPIHYHYLLIEFWRAGIRDTEVRDYGQEHWARYRKPFLDTVVEGFDKEAFTPRLSPDDVVDQLLATLAGAMVPRVLRFPAPTADQFRTGLLRQLAHMLGRTGYL